MNDQHPAITVLLERAGAGDADAVDRLLPLVFEQLRATARRFMADERGGHTLQPTALVHEAYLKLVGRDDLAHADRRAFFRAAGEAMRRILVDHARARGRQKRGGAWTRSPRSVEQLAAEADPQTIEGLSRAFDRLTAEAPEIADVVRLRLFAGLGVKMTAELLAVSEPTVKRRWAYARAWLYRALDEHEPDDPCDQQRSSNSDTPEETQT